MKPRSLARALVALASVVTISAQAPSPVLVRIETTLGNIDIAVDVQHAPITSANFLKYVDGHFYDGGQFYRAARSDTYHANPPNRPPMELVEARIPASKKSFPPIPLERTTITGLHHVVGTVSMGRNDDQPDSATNDFYILLNAQPSLDMGGKRFTDAQGTAAFGAVVAGMDVVKKINQQPVASREPSADNPLTKTQNLDPAIGIVRVYRLKPMAPATPDSARDSRAEYDTYLLAVRAAAMRGDAEAMGDLVTVDHVAVTGATGATLRGRAAQIASDKIAFGQMRIESFDMHATSFRSDGALMYAAGTGTHVVVDRSTGRRETDSFQYVDVLIRESDGRWRSKYFMNAPLAK